MNGARIPHLKNCLLEELYNRIIEGRKDRWASASTLKRALQIHESNQYLSVILDSLSQEGYVYVGSSLNQNKYSISETGLTLVESGWKYAETDNCIVDAWNEPDHINASQSDLNSIQFHLSQCITLILQSELSQSEKSQVIGLLNICEKAVELPIPKLGLIKRVLGWLKEIKDLAPLIEAIYKILKVNL